METIRYTEKKKSSKGVIFGFLLFVLIGGSIIVYSIKTEKNPKLIGKTTVETQSLVDLEKNKNEEVNIYSENVKYEVKDKKYNDKTNSKIKSDIVLPILTIDGKEFTELNKEIDDIYTERFNTLKSSLSKATNAFTYKVTYNSYENVLEKQKILSLTIYQRVKDDKLKKNTTEKVESYNIDLATQKVMKLSDIGINMFGKEYKTKINSSVREYLVKNSILKEEEYTYAITGLENFYIKDSKLHILFNEDEIVAKKYGVIDVTIK